MSSLGQLLSSFTVPLQIWLSPEARSRVAAVLVERLGHRAQIQTQALAHAGSLRGPAVLLVTAREIMAPAADDLRELAARAHPGRTVLIGGTDDRDTLMAGINEWGVVRVVPSDPDAETVLAAVADAEAMLKREVALETAIDDLDIENSMLASAIDQLSSGLTDGRSRVSAAALTSFAEGLAVTLEREVARLAEVGALDPRIEDARRGLSLLTALVDRAYDRATTHPTNEDDRHPPEPLDDIIEMVRQLIVYQGGAPISGVLGSGLSTSIEPLALVHHLMSMADRGPLGSACAMEVYRSGEDAVIELRYESADAAQLVSAYKESITWPLLASAGARITTTEADPHILRLNLPKASASNA